jgi:MFS transporter, DHA3 family, macrolide efflux protein
MRTFLFVWFGQLISTFGSGLTGFALSVYIYQETGSATQLGVAMLATVLPSLLVSPLAGALVDRWDRRWVMIASDSGAALTTLGIWALLAGGHLHVWHIYVANALSSILGSFQQPAYLASITLLVPKKHLGRASGLGQLGEAVSRIAAPALAGLLVVTIQVQGVILIDVLTFLFATLTLLLVRIPQPEVTAEGQAGRGSLLRESAFGWHYIRTRPGLLGMMILLAWVNLAFGFQNVLFTPLLLSFTTPAVMGGLMSVGGVGLLLGSLLMSAWGGTTPKIHGLMGSLFFLGLFAGLVGLRADPLLIGIANVGLFILVPIVNGSGQAIWQAKVAPDVQGRVFATRRLIALIALPISYLAAGPLADQVFEPLLAEVGPEYPSGGAWAGALGPILGTGPGRGIGLIFVIVGGLVALFAVLGYLHPRIRKVEQELPDYGGADPAPIVPDAIVPNAVIPNAEA